MGRAGETGLLPEIEVFCDSLLGVRLLPLGDGDKIVPVLHPQDVAGMTGAEEDEPREPPPRFNEEVQQLVAGDPVCFPARL